MIDQFIDLWLAVSSIIEITEHLQGENNISYFLHSTIKKSGIDNLLWLFITIFVDL